MEHESVRSCQGGSYQTESEVTFLSEKLISVQFYFCSFEENVSEKDGLIRGNWFY